MTEKGSSPAKKRSILFWLGIVLHGIFLVFLTFFLMNTDFVHGDEAWMIKNTSIVYRTLFPEPDKPSRDDFAFINVSNDLQLIERYDETGFPAGNQVITDRAKLGQVFKIMNQAPNWKFLLIDVFFADPSPDDSLIAAELKKLPNTLLSHHLNDSGEAWLPIFEGTEVGLASYWALDDEFLKFRVMREGLKTVPVKMFEMIDGGSYEKSGLFWKRNDNIAANDFIVDYRIRPYELFRDTMNYPFADLYDLLDLYNMGLDSAIMEFTRDRIVVIGDFRDKDMHPTIYGDMPGPLILTNLYLALKAGDNQYSMAYPLTLLIIYVMLSYILFTNSDFLEDWIRRKTGGENALLLLFAQGLSYLVILGAVSIICFFIFNFHINFLLLAIYINGIEWLQNYIKSRNRKKLKKIASEKMKEKENSPE